MLANSHTIKTSFEQIALKFSGQSALYFDGVTLTYQAINQQANRLAASFEEKGVTKGSYLAIFLQPGFEYVIAALATLKLGAVYVPIDPNEPALRVEQILDYVAPQLVVSEQALSPARQLSGFSIIWFEDIVCKLQYGLPDNPLVDIRPDDPACVLFTSGSTGTPKGVVVPHRAVINLVILENTPGINSQFRVAQFSNLAFDGALIEIWLALLNGATLFPISKRIRFHPDNLSDFLNTHGIDFIFLPTAYFNRVVTHRVDCLDSIKRLFFGGELANSTYVSQFLHYRHTTQNPVTIYNIYGPTEATGYVTYYSMTEQTSTCHPVKMLDIPLGKAIQNVAYYVLDLSYPLIFLVKL